MSRLSLFGRHLPDHVGQPPGPRRLRDPLHRAIFMTFLVSEVHPFLDGNGRLARIMMNAELAAADQVRVIIPIIYRSNCLSALRALSGNSWPESIIKTLAFAQRYVAAIPWSNIPQAIAVLTRKKFLWYGSLVGGSVGVVILVQALLFTH